MKQTPPTCPHCGSPTAPNLVGGLCPKCLASFFLAAPSEETPHEPSPNEPTPRPTSLRVVLVGGGQRFERVLLPGAPCLLGRAQACGICLEDQSISMEHARLCLASGRLLIEDLGSANGTWVDDRPITTPTPLLPGATLKLGACTLTIERVAAAAAQPAQPTPPSAHGLADGSVKGRNLELAQVIGEGGMGLIFEAKDHNVGRQVAVKKLKPAQRADPDQVARFIREAQIAGQLEHPGIVPVYELGVDAEGQPFYAMRRLRGVTLADVLADLSANAPQAIAAYPLGTLLAIFQKVCEAVAYAHSRQVIHRDLKPENIMLGQFGEVIVMDWGLAKTATTGEAGKPATPRGQSGSPPGGEMPPQPAGGTPALPGAPTQTLDDVVMGSPGYMAPEQAQGKTRQCDERTDVYALGAILYTILTLRPPVRGKDIHLLLDRTRSGDIRTPTDFNPGTWWSGSPGPAHPLPHCPGRRIPAPLSAIAMKALALAPEHRYQTVAELQRDLLAFQNGFLTTAEQAGFRRQLSVLVRRHRRGAAVLAAGIVLLGVVLAARYAATVWSRHGLRVTAPIYIDLASNLVREQKFDAALEKVDFALRLQPEEARFHTFKGNILEGQLMLREAASAYEQALRCNPADAAALTNRDLCTRILREAPAATNIPATLLHELRMACIRQGRGAEALAISARIRVDERRFFEMWQAYVKDHGIPASLYLEKGELCSWGFTNKWKDWSAFEGMPLVSLRNLSGGYTVSNLNALRGMPLRTLRFSETMVRDLSPLVGMPLTNLEMGFSPIRDLSPLKALPLRDLHIWNCPVENVAPISGLPLQSLSLLSTGVRDLRPLRGLPLRVISLKNSPIKDLSPLRGMPLSSLQLDFTPVTDISLVPSLPLRKLYLNGCRNLKSLAPLAGCTQLVELSYPKHITDLEVLRRLPSLKRIGHGGKFVPVEEFWKLHDAPKPPGTK